MKEKFSLFVYKVCLWAPTIICFTVLAYLLLYKDIMNWF